MTARRRPVLATATATVGVDVDVAVDVTEGLAGRGRGHGHDHGHGGRGAGPARALLCALLLATMLGVGCARNEPAPPGPPGPAPAQAEAAPHRDEESHAELPSRVRLSAAVIAAAGVRTTAVVARRLPLTVDLTGEVVADPDRSARLAARVPGRVAEVRCREGDRVKAGATLVSLESPELMRARAAHLSARARAEAARRNADRLAAVGKSGLAAGQEVQAAEAEAQALAAEAQAAGRALLSFGLPPAELGRLGGRLEIRTPIDGFVVARDATLGQTVAAEHVLCQVVDLERAFFVGRLFEKNLARVHVGEAAEVRLNAYPGEVFTGTVETIGKQLDPAARTVVARIVIKNRGDLLKVGLFGSARVTIPDSIGATGAPAAPALVVPLSAVTRVAERDVVFVRQPDDDFEVHPVTLGRSASGGVEVLSGLRPGEQVVSEGVFTLKSAVLKSTFGEED